MKRTRAARALLVVVAACGASCAAPTPVAPQPRASAPKSVRIVRAAGRAAMAIVARDGDPSPAVAAFVSTSGIGGTRGAIVPVALAGLIEARAGVTATPQADGVRISVRTREAEQTLARIAAALGDRVTEQTDLAVVKRKVLALAALPRVVGDEVGIASCEGALVPPADGTMPLATELEAWRAAAAIRERVAFAIVGMNDSPSAPALASGITDAKTPRAALGSYDASGEAPAGSAIVSIAWRGDVHVLGAARALGESSPLGALLAATEANARVRSVSSALSAHGACLSVRVQVEASTVPKIASIAALVTREARFAIEGARETDLAWSTDSAHAAEQAAIVALATDHETLTDDAPSVVVGIADANANDSRDALARAIDEANHASAARVVEARTRVESGQPASWMLVGSPCGTGGESDSDAGASAAFALAAATAARARGILAEPWIAADGVGIVANGADAKSLADSLARSFAVDPIEHVRAFESVRPGLAALAQAIAPSHPASVLPSGTAFALLRLSDATIAARADALRRGPIRVAMIANDDAPHADAAVARVDRFVAHGVVRACPARATPQTPKPGTYAVATEDGTSEAYVAALVPEAMENEASAIATALDGDGGLLDAALGDGLTREHSAHVLGPPGSRAIVVHLDAPASALDAAVAQTRALFDRLRQGALRAEDIARVEKRDATARDEAMRDPRARVIALFRDEKPMKAPTLEQARAAAAAILHDDALVIVAARPRISQKRTP